MKPINEIVKYIQKYPSENDYINKNNDIIRNGYIVIEKNKNDLSDKNMNILIDEYKTISTFFLIYAHTILYFWFLNYRGIIVYFY